MEKLFISFDTADQARPSMLPSDLFESIGSELGAAKGVGKGVIEDDVLDNNDVRALQRDTDVGLLGCDVEGAAARCED